MTKKLAKHANIRNKIKRRLREIFRGLRSGLNGAFDILVIARKDSIDCSFADLKRDFVRALRRGRVLSGDL